MNIGVILPSVTVQRGQRLDLATAARHAERPAAYRDAGARDVVLRIAGVTGASSATSWPRSAPS